jgi:hypothetical protein
MDTKIAILPRWGRLISNKSLVLEKIDLQLSFSVKCCFDELSPQKSLQLEVRG